MPGCRQYCSLDASLAFAVSGATSGLAIPIPNNPALVGLNVYLQAATLTPGFNPLGVLATNGIDVKLHQ